MSDFLPTLRALVRTYQAFEAYSGAHLRSLGLTPTQFDIIATLGNQPPMTYKLLSEKTLISKSSLSGVISRMMEKGLLQLIDNQNDGRSQLIKLTELGEQTFKLVFAKHISYLDSAFSKLTEKELEVIRGNLNKFLTIFKN
jgi:MarR family 2-MHQ and catechol resistance regulon transcriptional repressor